MSSSQSILWFRNDLRLADNPVLIAALDSGRVIPVFIWSPEEEGDWQPGAASRWWLHQSLKALSASLTGRGSRLILRKGRSIHVLLELLRETQAQSVFFDNRFEPALLKRDKEVVEQLKNAGYSVCSFNSFLFDDPSRITTQSGSPFKVFTRFWKTCLASMDVPRPIDAPDAVQGPKRWPRSLKLDDLELEPKIDWAGGMRESWQPGEAGAWAQWNRFLKQGAKEYAGGRNLPAQPGTSRLSPHLSFGEISPRQIWHELVGGQRNTSSLSVSHERFLAELGWREFASYLLFHFPETPEKPLRPEFDRFEWRKDPILMKSWQRGKTGYPIVDAGMRELWNTGWMHNRVRMVVASFLTKDILASWRTGARWFWDTLVDADLASNTLGWQWCAGCGADAMPYFRIFNPTLQGEKFDSKGDYVRRWVPELAKMPARWIHQPWRAPEPVLSAAGVKLGETYPRPIISHEIARNVALEKFRGIKTASSH